jgi:outer membrane protein insertion porin family
MISRWKAARISSAALALALAVASRAVASGAEPDSVAGRAVAAAGTSIASVRFTGARAVSSSALERGSLLKKGLPYSDALLSLERARIDSLYFAAGRLGTGVAVDTSRAREGIDVRFDLTEGDVTTVGTVTVSGSGFIDQATATKRIRPAAGEPFNPFTLERSLASLLELYVESGYPFAQVWLTGFTYRKDANEVDLAISLFEGERSRISRVVFEGLAKTDSTVAIRTSRLRPGSIFDETDIADAARYLSAAGYFESVGEPRVEKRPGGTVDVIIPVKDIQRSNLFQGALGFSKKNGGTYILNGSVEFDLRNIAGTGRNVHFDWLNDGVRYSRLNLTFREPFVLSSSAGLDGEITQVVEDSSYTWHSGGLYVTAPLRPHLSILAGATADRNVPDAGELLRSVRQRYRVGLSGEGVSRLAVRCYVEGAYKNNYLRGNRSEADRQLLGHVEGRLTLPGFAGQSVFVRLVSDAIFSSGAVPLAETFPLGGATTLRGYRESQFRGEKIAFMNLEYRFGEGGWFFLFDDVGTFYRAAAGWQAKNGVGFGVRSASSLGAIALSFGVGDQLSFEGTRIHISLIEQF